MFKASLQLVIVRLEVVQFGWCSWSCFIEIDSIGVSLNQSPHLSFARDQNCLVWMPGLTVRTCDGLWVAHAAGQSKNHPCSVTSRYKIATIRVFPEMTATISSTFPAPEQDMVCSRLNTDTLCTYVAAPSVLQTKPRSPIRSGSPGEAGAA